MSNSTLNTGWEIIKNNPIDHNVPAKEVSDYIYDVENEIARTCLGIKFYGILLDDAKDFGSLEEWSSQKSYSTTNQVIYRNVVYAASQPHTGVDPSNSSHWTVVTKFSKTAYNDLWEKHLKRYAATEVFNVAARFIYSQVKATGIVKRNDPQTGSQSLSRGEFSDFRNDIQKIASMQMANMVKWINDNQDVEAYKEEGVSLFEDFMLLECGEENACQVPKSRFFFSNEHY